jgi:GNAT superfamily N-acetyltransferase
MAGIAVNEVLEMDVTVREAHPGDLPEIVPLWLQLMSFHEELDAGYSMVEDAAERWIRYIAPSFNDESWRIFVAQIEDELVGYAAVVIQDHPPVYVSTKHGVLESIAVSREHRGRGIGKRLVRAAEQWLRSRDVFEMTVRIDERNTASRALFGSRAFEPWIVVRRKVLGRKD